MKAIDPRQALLGLAVNEALIQEEALYLHFDGGWTLVVTNAFVLKPADVEGMVGACLVGFEGNDRGEKLQFDTDAVLTVDLSDAAHRGPEAIQLVRPDGHSIIWN